MSTNTLSSVFGGNLGGNVDIGGSLETGSGNVALVGTDGKINGPLRTAIIDDLSGANLTAIPGGQITGAIAAVSGANLTTLNGSNISSGTVANARLPTNVDLGGTLDVTGVATLDSTLNVTGASTLNNTLLIDHNGVTPVTFKRDSGNNGHGVGIDFRLGDAASASANHPYGQVLVSIGDNTDGGEDGLFIVNLSDDGSMVEVIRMFGASGGVAIGDTTDPGADALSVAGALSKGSGSFKISHPLPELADSKYLVHSFIEGPKADLIYRGTATLEDGEAIIDLDTAAGMTTGTWELLCRDAQCYTTNETGWHHVRGTVSGSTLIIDCEEECDDVVSWMVVASRKDPHMKDSGTLWTDNDGYPIVEPNKEETE